MTVKHACIVGVGLIGGSLAAAWKQAGFAERISGIESNADAAQQALELGLVDDIIEQVPATVELIAVCTPSDKIANKISMLASHGAVLFDVGSVKAPIISALQKAGDMPPHYVASHPIAGSERSGPSAADGTLFTGTATVITPLLQTDASAQALVTEAWQATGAHVLTLSADEHDAMLAVTSHLPHLLAFTFMQQVEPGLLPFSGGGFRDFTRIAAANPELWWRIFSMNKDQILAAASTFRGHLDDLTNALADDDEARGVAALSGAATLRKTLDT